MKTNRPNLVFRHGEVTREKIEYYMARGSTLRSQFICRLLAKFWRKIVHPKAPERPCRKTRVVLRYCHPQGKS